MKAYISGTCGRHIIILKMVDPSATVSMMS
jgi:hypothetical protein